MSCTCTGPRRRSTPRSVGGRVAGALAALALLEVARLHGARIVWTVAQRAAARVAASHARALVLVGGGAAGRRGHPSERGGRQEVVRRSTRSWPAARTRWCRWAISEAPIPSTISRDEARASLGHSGPGAASSPFSAWCGPTRTCRTSFTPSGRYLPAAQMSSCWSAAPRTPRHWPTKFARPLAVILECDWCSATCPTTRSSATSARPISWCCRSGTSPTPPARCSRCRSTGRYSCRPEGRWASSRRSPAPTGSAPTTGS